MARCRHQTVVISEETISTIHFEWDGSEVEDGSVSGPDPTGRYTARCDDCSATVHFTLQRLRRGHVPAWVQAAFLAVEQARNENTVKGFGSN